MTYPAIASLSALLVAKGAAGPSGRQRPDPMANVANLGARSSGSGSGNGRGGRRTEDSLRVSMRIDQSRHKRLRLAAALLGENRQALLVAALDNYLDSVMPTLMDEHCPCLERGTQSGVVGLAVRDEKALAEVP